MRNLIWSQVYGDVPLPAGETSVFKARECFRDPASDSQRDGKLPFLTRAGSFSSSVETSLCLLPVSQLRRNAVIRPQYQMRQCNGLLHLLQHVSAPGTNSTQLALFLEAGGPDGGFSRVGFLLGCWCQLCQAPLIGWWVSAFLLTTSGSAFLLSCCVQGFSS